MKPFHIFEGTCINSIITINDRVLRIFLPHKYTSFPAFTIFPWSPRCKLCVLLEQAFPLIAASLRPPPPPPPWKGHKNQNVHFCPWGNSRCLSSWKYWPLAETSRELWASRDFSLSSLVANQRLVALSSFHYLRLDSTNVLFLFHTDSIDMN